MVLWIILGRSQNWTTLGGHYIHFRVFLKVKVQNWNIFRGMPDVILILFC